VNYEYEENVHFQAAAEMTFADWATTQATVDLYSGMNTLVVTTNPHAEDGSKPHIDRMIVKQLSVLQRCTPNTKVPIVWGTDATSGGDSNNVVLDNDFVQLGLGFDGQVSGYTDLGALGPWTIQFEVEGDMASDQDQTVMYANNRVVETVAGWSGDTTHDTTRKLNAPVDAATVQWSFSWDAMSSAPEAHMKIKNGFAVCQGCTDVTCDVVNHDHPELGATKLIKVSHAHGQRGGEGFEGVGEDLGNHHECSYDNVQQSCDCVCREKDMSDDAEDCLASDNEYRHVSTYMNANKEMKSVTRCLACPEGKTVSQNNQDRCQYEPGYIYPLMAKVDQPDCFGTAEYCKSAPWEECPIGLNSLFNCTDSSTSTTTSTTTPT
jgi:hypothetical protein